VNWQLVKYPKDHGGLGVRDPRNGKFSSGIQDFMVTGKREKGMVEICFVEKVFLG
jgi:hypothetical protein